MDDFQYKFYLHMLSNIYKIDTWNVFFEIYIKNYDQHDHALGWQNIKMQTLVHYAGSTGSEKKNNCTSYLNNFKCYTNLTQHKTQTEADY